MKKLALAAVAALVAFPAFADQQRDSVAKNLIAMGNIIDVFGYACNLSDGDREAADIAVSATAEQFNIDLNWLANEIRKRNSAYSKYDIRGEDFRAVANELNKCRLVDDTMRRVYQARAIIGH